MSYKVKATGITEFKNYLKEIKRSIQVSLKEIDGKSAEIQIEGLPVSFNIKKDRVSEILKTLPVAIKKAHREAVSQLTILLEEALNDAMDSQVWDWNGETRDIVDTGALKDSLKIYVDSDSDIHILYNQEYAAIVHYGGYFSPFGNKSAKVYYPGRPWVTSLINGGGPIPQFDFEGEYKALMSLALENILK